MIVIVLFQVSIYDAHVSKYWSPSEYSLELSPPDMFTWSMAKMHIRFEKKQYNLSPY